VHRRPSVRHFPLLACTSHEDLLRGIAFKLTIDLGLERQPNIHWVVPMLSGVTFSIGMLLTFMALINYLTDAYEIYAASANAASSTTRSIFGAVLPFAAAPLYTQLGVHWATSLLGFISLAMSLTPFAFIRYGQKIRATSKMSKDLAESKRLKANRDAHTHAYGC
jgi:hypothetical protein